MQNPVATFNGSMAPCGVPESKRNPPETMGERHTPWDPIQGGSTYSPLERKKPRDGLCEEE